mgnify:CR=1 FL=1
MEFEPIYETASNGKEKYWNIKVEKQGDYGVIKTTYGYTDGKLQTIEKIIDKGKNIGKKNETTALEQAISEANSLWKKKNDTINVLLPMLAQDFKKHKKHITYPCLVQPKLDGVRMLCRKSNGIISFISRKGKELHGLQHIIDELNTLNIMKDGDVWDGELYSNDMTFDEISGYCRKFSSDSTVLPEFWVFDTCSKDIPFYSRCPYIESYNITKYIRQVDSTICNSEEEVYSYLKLFENDGWEGIMVRNKDGLYKYNYRSYDLQKLKSFSDSEFIIIDVKEGTGVDKNTAIFICKSNTSEHTFSCRPEGSRELRCNYLQNKNKYIGSFLTVKYQELTKNGIPRFPVGISIRDYE